MTTYAVEVTEPADADLHGIFQYIAFTLLSPENAAGQLDRLESRIKGLSTMPKRFSQYGKEPWHSRGLRMMPVDNYCVLYVPDDEHSVVTVIRVMYGGEDIDEQLAKYTEL
mgnify:FL=1